MELSTITRQSSRPTLTHINAFLGQLNNVNVSFAKDQDLHKQKLLNYLGSCQEFTPKSVDLSKFQFDFTYSSMLSLLSQKNSIKVIKILLGLPIFQDEEQASMPQIIQLFKNPELETLELSVADISCIELLQTLRTYCKNIKHITLNATLSIEPLSTLLKALWGEDPEQKSSIQNLVLSDNHELTDNDCDLIGTFCPNLTQINLDGCTSITDDGLSKIVTNCPRLTQISMKACLPITDHGLMSLLNNCPELTCIDMRGCYNIISSLGRSINVAHNWRLDFDTIRIKEKERMQEIEAQYPNVTFHWP